MTCGVCDDQIAIEGSQATQCLECELIQCNECLVEWTKTCVKKIYVAEGQDLPPLSIPCAKEGCAHRYSLETLEVALLPEFYEEVCKAMTVRMLQGQNEDFVTCPNKQCQSFGFPGPNIEAPYFACSEPF